MKEFDLIALKHDIQDYGLKSGDVGTVVHCYDDKDGFEVEFITAGGKTIAVLTLSTRDIKPFEKAEILHIRDTALATGN
ncbi:MAG TPA: DUF4926 domain-containing protein [bacterium]|nr:DUF4926 domain-containing protein [bacterium]HPN45588.1 DUF4926 domain-containing protein [bacterium]